MRKWRLLTLLFFVPCVVLITISQGFCDLSPGDVIDKTNWEKVEGLLPGPMDLAVASLPMHAMRMPGRATHVNGYWLWRSWGVIKARTSSSDSRYTNME